ncbi:hypothetical protein BDZ89DRAFT_1085188 [Hymenopellis radicata]|nr:hypothetical protein BDZ89DRAFT_1085188 [Hymenopellis radicata]
MGHADPQSTRTLQKRSGSIVGLAVGVTLGVLILLCVVSLVTLWLYLRRKRSRFDGDRTIYKPVEAADLDLDDGPIPMTLYNMPNANGSFNPYDGRNMMPTGWASVTQSTLVGQQTSSQTKGLCLSTSSARSSNAALATTSHVPTIITAFQRERTSAGVPRSSPHTQNGRRASSAGPYPVHSPPLSYGNAKGKRSASADAALSPASDRLYNNASSSAVMLHHQINPEEMARRKRSHERYVEEKRRQSVAIAQSMEVEMDAFGVPSAKEIPRTGRSVRRAASRSAAPPAYLS